MSKRPTPQSIGRNEYVTHSPISVAASLSIALQSIVRSVSDESFSSNLMSMCPMLSSVQLSSDSDPTVPEEKEPAENEDSCV